MATLILITAAGVFSALAFFLRPVWALSVYCVSLFCYPQTITLAFGPADFPLARIVILALLANLVLRQKLWVNFKWNWLDTFVVAALAARVLSLTQNVDPNIFIVREGGTVFEMLLPYFAVRMVLTDKETLLKLFKALIIMAIPLAVAGAYQSKTGHNPLGFLRGSQKTYVENLSPQAQIRYGLYRAGGTFGNSIAFGLFFAGLAPLALALWRFDNKKLLPALIGFGFMGIGVVSSMSSAPAFSVTFSMMFICGFPFRRYWPVLAAAVIGATLFVEVYSNRHFYHVLTLFALNSSTAYYRIQLLEEAFGGGMRDHWIFGYGYVGIGPGNDNTNFHWRHQDLTNIYIGFLARYGLVGLIPFLVLNVLFYFRLYKAAKLTRNRENEWIIWCLAAALVGWNGGMMTVGALQQNENFFYMFVAMCNNMPLIMARGATAAVPAHAKDKSRNGFIRNRFGHIMRKKHA